MKNLKHFFLLSCVSIFSISCTNNDNQFYNVQYANATGLVTIQTQPSYSVNDILYVNASFSRYLYELNQPNLLDIYRTTGGATKYNFSYVLEKQNSSSGWSVVNNPLTVVQGSAISGSYILGSCIYNPLSQNYEYKVGVPLLTTGNYRLNFGYNSNSNNSVELRSESTGNNLFLNIDSQISGLDANGNYSFTVN
jgi:hypothetical protein